MVSFMRLLLSIAALFILALPVRAEDKSTRAIERGLDYTVGGRPRLDHRPSEEPDDASSNDDRFGSPRESDIAGSFHRPGSLS